MTRQMHVPQEPQSQEHAHAHAQVQVHDEEDISDTLLSFPLRELKSVTFFMAILLSQLGVSHNASLHHHHFITPYFSCQTTASGVQKQRF